MIPTTLAILVFVALEYFFYKQYHDLEVGLGWAIGGFFLAWIAAYVSGRIISYRIDNPTPTYHNLPPEIIWEQADRALQTVKSGKTPWRSGYSVTTPLPDQPICISAQCEVSHPSLEPFVELIGKDHLRSELYLDIQILAREDDTELKLVWRPESPITRLEHNHLIQITTYKIQELIREQELLFDQ